MKKRIAKESKEEILEKVKKGEKVVDLASQYGISDKTIHGDSPIRDDRILFF